MTRTEKNAALNAKLASAGGVLDVKIVTAMYHEIVDRGLRKKASHAIHLCAGTEADTLITEAFAYDPRNHGLYAIRNDINHGTVKINDPETLMLVESRFSSIFRLVRMMLNGVLRINALQRADALSP